MNNQVVPQGYKNSKVGIIPVEWEVVRLGDVSLKISDGLHSTPKYEDGTKYFFINGNNLIKNEIIIFNNTKSVSQEEYLKHKRDLTNKTILMSINGTIGNLAIYNNEEVVLGKSACYINIKNNIDFKYIYLLLSSNLIQASFKSELTGSTIKNLSLKTIKNTAIPLPPLKEQQKIAEILATWDNAISKQEELVKAKEELKKGLMQKLLSGEVRFDGFDGEWEDTKLIDIAKITMGQSPSSNSYNESNIGIPLIQGNADCKNRKTLPRNYTTEKTKECFINDIIMTVRAPVGVVSKSFHNACIGRGVCAIQSKKDNEFLYHYLVNYEQRWIKYSQGSIFTAVNSGDIKNLKIQLPPLKEEQQKIAQVLSNADKEIELLKDELQELKKQKKGLMQKLLTGKVRVKV